MYCINLIFRSFGQMIRPLIDSMRVTPAAEPGVSTTASVSSSLNGPETIFEPRKTSSGATRLREKADGWLVLFLLSLFPGSFASLLYMYLAVSPV